MTARRSTASATARTTGTSATARTTASMLRTLADAVEAGERSLSPTLHKALVREMRVNDEDEVDETTWEKEWGEEIDRRLANHRAGKSKVHNAWQFLESLKRR